MPHWKVPPCRGKATESCLHFVNYGRNGRGFVAVVVVTTVCLPATNITIALPTAHIAAAAARITVVGLPVRLIVGWVVTRLQVVVAVVVVAVVVVVVVVVA